MKKISIIGCGWLGLPLAKKLIQQNYSVIGSTTQQNKIELLKKNNIKAFHMAFPSNISTLKELCQSETIIITLPFKRSYSSPEIYKDQIKIILNVARKEKVKKIIFTSSTSVYSNTNTLVKEDDIITATTSRQKTLLETEKLIENATFSDHLIIRLSGLYGPDREIGKFIHKKSIQNGNNKVNLIHRDDVINILIKLLESKHWNETINLVSNHHPTKEELYTKKAVEKKITPPSFDQNSNLNFKIVSNKKLKKLLNYTFIHPNPLE